MRSGPATRTVTLAGPDDVAGWREAARGLVRAGMAPDAVTWAVTGEAAGLFGSEAGTPAPDHGPGPGANVTVRTSRAFLEAVGQGLLHSDPERWALAYDILWRMQREPRLMEDRSDRAVARMHTLVRGVRRDVHKMRAFVRFRKVEDDGAGREAFVAWFEPEHYIERHNAPFFAQRFAGMDWTIVTPRLSVSWDGREVSFGAGGDRAMVPPEDAAEEAWRTYYRSIFNPNRLKISAMRSEMPVKYWRNLPEASLIQPLIGSASARSSRMVATPAEKLVVTREEAGMDLFENATEGSGEAAGIGDNSRPRTLEELHEVEKACRLCPLWEPATQVVPGVGPQDAAIMVVGEQPGDQEDKAGEPFIGPAGQMFNQVIEEVGIDRSGLFVTNAVKHFKYELRGKRRIHQKPDTSEIKACRTWFLHERAIVRPKLIVAMGATGARAVTGKTVTISRTRGSIMDLDEDTKYLITVHPSYLLRLPDEHLKRIEREKFARDLELVRDWARENGEEHLLRVA